MRIEKVLLYLFSIMVIIYLCPHSFAQLKTDSLTVKKEKKIRLKLETGPEYLYPTKDDRRIHTFNYNLYAGAEFFKHFRLSLYGGITLTYDWGHIFQWDSNFINIRHENAAGGAGPVFLIRIEPFIFGQFSLSGDFSGGIMFYTSHFPYGGDIYNFMWRFGGSAKYQINRQFAFSVDGKWMHVSNCQGMNSHNPSYEGAGVSVELVRYF